MALPPRVGLAHLVSSWADTLAAGRARCPVETTMTAQPLLALDTFPTDRETGFEIGWDFAHHGLVPPVEWLAIGSPLRHGWDAGRANFGPRTLGAPRAVRKWLQLRLNAWRRGRAFETVQVTPNYLRQIDADVCPITREPLTHCSGTPADASIDRVRNDAGYAAGNLAVMSTRANEAKGDADFDAALSAMRRAESTMADVDGLPAAAWARVAVLCSFVTPLPHAQAAGLPLLVLPPNRLRLLNPAQALQALLTRQFGRDGFSARLARIEALLPGKPLRRDFQRFVHAMLPRVLEAGRDLDDRARAWALEDAWRNPLVLRCWTRFARQLDAAACERIVLRAAALRLAPGLVQPYDDLRQATEGWALENAGYVARRPAPPRRHRADQPSSSTISIAPQGHSVAQMPQPLQ